MTTAFAVAEATRAAHEEPHMRERLFNNRSDVQSIVPEDLLERARVQLRNQQGSAAVQRIALLGFLLAQLEEVPFEATAIILGVRPPRLEKMMHGEESIPASYEKRWTLIAETLVDLHSVVRPRATWRWFNLNVPALGNKTPIEVIGTGRGPDKIRELTRGYRDESFT